jgi:hypothetical protein
MTVSTKQQLFALPLLKGEVPSSAEFVGQVYFCLDRARTSLECGFIKVASSRGGKLRCPTHGGGDMRWNNLYKVQGRLYRWSP